MGLVDPLHPVLTNVVTTLRCHVDRTVLQHQVILSPDHSEVQALSDYVLASVSHKPAGQHPYSPQIPTQVRSTAPGSSPRCWRTRETNCSTPVRPFSGTCRRVVILRRSNGSRPPGSPPRASPILPNNWKPAAAPAR